MCSSSILDVFGLVSKHLSMYAHYCLIIINTDIDLIFVNLPRWIGSTTIMLTHAIPAMGSHDIVDYATTYVGLSQLLYGNPIPSIH